MSRSLKKNMSLLCAMAAVAAFAGPADAIYKCTTANGVVYQDRPCREGNETDVRIVVPTGEVAPRGVATLDAGAFANDPRNASRAGTRKPGRAAADDPDSAAKAADGKSADAAASSSDSSRKKEPRTGAEKTATPMTAEQARKADPTAKYYAAESFGSGAETPTQMNCESPSGEKRMFYLSDGKLTSI